MKLNRMFTPAALALSLVATGSASAQNRHGGDRRGGGEQHAQARAEGPRGGERHDGGGYRGGDRRDGGYRGGYSGHAYVNGDRGHVYASPRSYGWGARSYGYRSYYRPSFRSYYRPYYRPSYFYRPYYGFRPRFSIGFGLYVGYPVPYPYTYSYPYPVPYPYPAYGYPDQYPPAYSNPYPPAYQYPQGQYQQQDQYPDGQYPQDYSYDNNAAPYNNNVAPQSGSAMITPGTTGGLSFDIQPTGAEVYVDGQYYGPCSNFTPRSQPLALSPGRHRVEIRAQGYQDMTFDAEITAGQVLPYQGTLAN